MALTATAFLRPVRNSGISAELTFVESHDGETLSVLGAATGMRPLDQYVSVVHDLYSNADVISPFTGSGPCMPSDGTISDPSFPAQQPGDLVISPSAMTRTLLGFWHMQGIRPGETIRELHVVRPTAPTLGLHLYEIGTVSIRQATLPLMPDPSLDDRPRLFTLQACGQVVRTP